MPPEMVGEAENVGVSQVRLDWIRMFALAILAGAFIALGAMGLTALNIPYNKTSLEFVNAILLGIFCNTLVCLVVWLCMRVLSTADRVQAIILPITAFVAAGFEHCVANMYFIPKSLFIKAGADPAFWTNIAKTAADFPNITWRNFCLANLLPVSIGNIIGGEVMVSLVYWSIHLRISRYWAVKPFIKPAGLHS